MNVIIKISIIVNFLKDFSYLFLDREEGREKERERKINVRLPLTCPPLGTWTATQACAPTGNRTGDPLVRRPALSPLSHTSQGQLLFILINIFKYYYYTNSGFKSHS